MSPECIPRGRQHNSIRFEFQTMSSGSRLGISGTEGGRICRFCSTARPIQLQNPSATFFTDGSASKATASAGWGVNICQRDLSVADLWGLVLTDHDLDWIGALRPSSNTKQRLLSCPPMDSLHHDNSRCSPGLQHPRRQQILCATFRGRFHIIKGRCNKRLIQQVYLVLQSVKLCRNLSIGWVKAHTDHAT